MKKVFLALTFCFFSSSVFAKADYYDDGYCADLTYKAPIMNFTSSFGELTYDFSKTSDEITRLSNEKTGKVAGLAHCPALGFLRITIVPQQIGRRTCLFAYSIDVFYGYQNPVIYIDKNIEEGTCKYKHVVRHEKQHMAIYVLGLEYFIPKVKSELEKEFIKILPRQAFSQDHANKMAAEMRAEYDAVLTKHLDKLNVILNRWQKLLDNKENYHKEHLVCLKRDDPNLHMYMTLDDESDEYSLEY